MQLSSILPIDRALSGATTLGQSGPRSDGIEGELCTLQSSSIIEISLSDCLWEGSPRGVMVKVMDCGIVVSEFVFHSRYYVHFRTNTFEKGMNPFILPNMG